MAGVLDLRAQYVTGTTTTVMWGVGVGGYFESPELGDRIGNALRGRQLMMVAAVKAAKLSKVLEIFAAQQPPLEMHLIAQIEPLLNFSEGENFHFEVDALDEEDEKKDEKKVAPPAVHLCVRTVPPNGGFHCPGRRSWRPN